jgi:hypothetical protein
MRTKSFYYSDRQNALIEKAALSENPGKRARSLAKQFKRPYNSIMVKIYKIRMSKGLAKKSEKISFKESNFMKFSKVKKAEVYNNHIRIYF